jgi:hypothetical protein
MMVAVMIHEEKSVGRWLKNWMELVCLRQTGDIQHLKK